MQYTLHHGNCLDIMPTLPDSSVDLVLTDPPYFKVKGEAWDRQWDKPKQFLAWLDQCAEQWQRILKPNGSLYCFASPQMSARVECLLSDRMNVLNCIRWQKQAGWHNKAKKEQLRSFLSPWESIIFAEHYGADNIAKGEVGYAAKCDELRGVVFEPLRAYICGEYERSGVKTSDVATYLNVTETMIRQHYLSKSQWALPTLSAYSKQREALNALTGGGYLHREYEDLRREYEDLRREYEDLRREYEDLRRPFEVTKDVPYTDVWTFEPVRPYKGKHPCEKPQDMLRHMITASTRDDAVVLDCFAGTGSTGVACANTGRRFIGIELDAGYFEIASRRVAEAYAAAPNSSDVLLGES